MALRAVITRITIMDSQPLLRLLHLVSPSLPTGAFSYSQGLEFAVESGWVHEAASLEGWIHDQLATSIMWTDVPILVRMYNACRAGDEKLLDSWCSLLLACRETLELRMEEQNRGRALAVLLQGLDLAQAGEWRKTLSRSQLAGYSLAASAWNIALQEAALGYVWAWLENQVLAGVKIIPLGQTAGQCILSSLAGHIAAAVRQGLEVDDDAIGASCPALAIASSLHETQYTRLYRS